MGLKEWIGRIRKSVRRWSDWEERVSSGSGSLPREIDKGRLTSLKRLEAHIGHRFHRIQWLDLALTHKSFTHESSPAQINPPGGNGNEVLEFLGDAVLNLAVTALLLREFPEAHEGALSKRRSHLVKRKFLAQLSRELRLEEHLLLGKGELRDGGRRKASILANTYEAVIGALYLDSGYDSSLKIIRDHFRHYLKSEKPLALFDDFKSRFQEHAQRYYRLSPRYEVVEEAGPDHDKRFQATVLIGQEIRREGRGKSKKEAEQEAARKALEEVGNKEAPIIT